MLIFLSACGMIIAKNYLHFTLELKMEFIHFNALALRLSLKYSCTYISHAPSSTHTFIFCHKMPLHALEKKLKFNVIHEVLISEFKIKIY